MSSVSNALVNVVLIVVLLWVCVGLLLVVYRKYLAKRVLPNTLENYKTSILGGMVSGMIILFADRVEKIAGEDILTMLLITFLVVLPLVIVATMIYMIPFALKNEDNQR